MEYTKERAMVWLNKHWQSPKSCPICQNNNWGVSDSVVEAREFRLGACPRISVIGSLKPGLAYQLRAQMGPRPLTSSCLCKAMATPQRHGTLTRAISSP